MQAIGTINWLSNYPALNSITHPAWLKVVAAARPISLPAGATIFRDGEACQNYLLVLNGCIRVQKVSENGHEIALYRVTPGETCELTTACLLASRRYSAGAIAETPVEAVFIPKVQFQEALTLAPEFRDFIYSTLDQGISSLIALLEEVAFAAMDQRLAHQLLKKSDQLHSMSIQATHHSIACDLGTAREVVSRLLKDFERHGWVQLHRARIEITDMAALRRLASREVT